MLRAAAPGRPWPSAPPATERDQALYFDQMDRKLPVGLGRDGAPIYVNLEFLDGTRGAHVSISGISGVATKTSFALFLLHSIFRSGVLGQAPVNAKALVFSVKGEDLLFLDQPNIRLDDDLRADYAELGLPAEPFALGRLLRPADPGRPDRPARTSPAGPAGSSAFWWTLAEFCRGELLPYVFADAEDERNQYTMVIHQVAARLRRDAQPAGQDGAVSHRRHGPAAPTTELVDVIVDRLTDDDTRRDWAGPVTGIGTVNAFIRRLRSSLRAAAAASCAATWPTTPAPADRPPATSRSPSSTCTTCPSARSGSSSASCSPPRPRARRRPGPGGLLFTMIDELNKYAPREGSCPIKDVLLDIAERGRSLGHHPDRRAADRQRGGAADRVATPRSRSSAGSTRPRPGAPSTASCRRRQRPRATLAKPGTMFVSQPEIPVPLAVEFPFPAWATRLSECGDRRRTAPAPDRRTAATSSTGCPPWPTTTFDDAGIDRHRRSDPRSRRNVSSR